MSETPEFLLLKDEDTSAMDSFLEHFVTKTQVEIIFSNPTIGALYKIRDQKGRWIQARVVRFSRDYNGQSCYWCNILKVGWMS